MKIAARILSLVILAALSAFYISCDKKDDPKKNEKDEQIEKLVGTWKASSVTLDGQSPTQNFDDFTLTISGSPGNESITYTVTGRPEGPNVWPTSGTFTFDENDVTGTLIRDQASEDLPIDYTVSETSLVLEFNFSGDPFPNGRVENVTGNWHFEFTKQ